MGGPRAPARRDPASTRPATASRTRASSRCCRGRALWEGGDAPQALRAQGVGQPDDVSKGRAGLLPTRCHTVGTLAGHVPVSMIGNSRVRLARIGTVDGGTCPASRMEALRSEGLILHKSKLVPDDPIGQASEAYGAFRIEVPAYVPLRDGKLVRKPQKAVRNLFAPPKKRKPKAKARGEEKAAEKS